MAADNSHSEISPTRKLFSSLAMVGCAATHPGLVRQENQDTVLWHTSENRGSLAIVADGMGGHSGGRIASSFAAATLSGHYFGSCDPPHRALEQAVEAANSAVFRRAAASSELAGMGTTCLALAIREDQSWFASIGDSRLYLLRNENLYQMSDDHTVVADLVREGKLTARQARDHVDRNVLSRALGTHPSVTADFWPKPFRIYEGDRFLLCSDGLYDLLDETELLPRLQTSDPCDSVTSLIDAALARGGHDNISVVVVEARAVGRDI